VVNAGMTAVIVLVGVVTAVVVNPTAASAHDNSVTGVASCSPVGASWDITWTIANDYNLSETASVLSATGGVGTVSGSPVNIAASPGMPYKTGTMTQVLPGSTTGTATITVQGTWSDNFTTTDQGNVSLPKACVPPSPPVSTAPAHSSIVLGNSNSDTATVTGVSTVTPTGTVTFYVCGPFTTATACTTAGTNLGAVNLSGSAGTATATSPTVSPTATGTYCFLGVYSGDSNYSTSSDGSTTSECFTVTKATPGFITTPANPNGIVLGSSSSDSATVTGVVGKAPTGTVTFSACKETTVGTPCSGGTTVGSLTAPTSSSGAVATYTLAAGVFTPTSTGTYCFNASYGGDGNYSAVSAETNPAAECFAVTVATPSVTTAPTHGSIALGASNTDVATVTGNTGGPTPTGTVTFYVCGPFTTATACTTAGTNLGTVTLAAGTATSPAYTPPVTGTYCFLGVYSGDTNYQGGQDSSTTRECFTVNTVPSGVTTAPTHGSIALGASNTDVATVTGNTGGPTPTGTVTFYVCGPFTTATACTTAGTNLGTVTLAAGTATSPAYTPPVTGTYCFLGVYSGDTNYQGGQDSSTTRECFTVNTVPSGVTTAPTHGSIALGASNTDVATVTGNTGGPTPTGTVTFYVCGPFTTATACTTAGTNLGTVTLAAGTATSPAYTPPVTGTYCFLGVYSGDTNYQGGQDSSTTRECFTVNTVPSGVTTAPTHGSIALGASNTDVATVTGNTGGPTPTGTVTFYVCGPFTTATACTTAGTNLGTVTLAAGTATSPAYTPPVTGTYCFLGVYSGDTNYQGGQDSSTTRECFTVNTVPSGVTTAPTHGSIALGASNTDVATVTGNTGGPTPTGTVTFYVCGPFTTATACTTAGTNLGTVTLAAGTATSPAYTPPVTGTYCFLGVYSGDTNYQGGQDSSTTRECFTVNTVPSGVTTAPTHGSIALGASNTDVATVTGNTGGPTPTGTVTFYVCGPFTTATACTTAGTNLGTVTLAAGTATSPAYTPPVTGTYCFLGVYSGDTNYQGGQDSSTTRECFTVNTVPSGVTTAPTHGSIALGASNTDVATVTGNTGGPTPTGTVTFYVCGPFTTATACTTAGTNLGTVTLAAGTATSPAYTPPVTGTYCFLGVYSGDTNYQGGQDSSTTRECFTVNTVPSGVTTAPTHGSIALGASNTDVATVTGNTGGPTPTGTVTFYVCGPFTTATACTTAGTNLGTVTLAAGTATSPAYTPPVTGTYCFLGVYSGDTNYQGGQDSSTTRECFTVNTVPSGVTTAPTHGSIALGASNTDVATVTGNTGGPTPTGTVTFYVCGPFTTATACTTAGTNLGTVTLAAGTATSPAYTPPVTGTYCFLGVYSGDTNYQGGQDSSTTRECFTVTKAPSSTTTSPASGSIVLGASDSDTATVTGNTGGPTPTGTVTFYVCAGNANPCTSTTAGVVDLGTVALAAGTATSPTYTPPVTGTYCFLGVYSGDTNYMGSSDSSTTRECFTVTKAPSSTTTSPASGSIVLGASDSDTATVTGNTGGPTPTGTVTFYVCAGNANPCTSTTAGVVDLGTVALAAGTATSPTYTPPSTGTYCFLGVYSGDGNYMGSSDSSTTRECFTVTKAPSSTTTSPSSGSIVLGASNTDVATVTGNTGGPTPTGTVTFYVCGPFTTATACTTAGTNLGTVTLAAGTATSPTYTPPSTGTYCFLGVYSGDGNYQGGQDSSTTRECFTVTKAPSTTTTSPTSGTFLLGNSNTDTATVTGNAGGPTPTGTVHFYVCAGQRQPLHGDHRRCRRPGNGCLVGRHGHQSHLHPAGHRHLLLPRRLLRRRQLHGEFGRFDHP
jgi:hypothetical protein